MDRVDILIKNGLIVTIDKDMQIIEDGAVAIKNGNIVDVGLTKEIDLKYNSDKTINASSKIVMPGLINAHTHSGMTYFRGLADDLPLDRWLNKYIWPTEAKFLSEEFIYNAVLHSAAEMVKNGIVLFNDMYFFGKQCGEAASRVGIRAIIGEVVLDSPVANCTNPEQIIDYSVNQHKEFEKDELIEYSIAPHSIYACCKETLQLSAETARNNNMLLHIHVSETKKEIEDCIKNNSKPPIEYLHDIGFLSEDVLSAHGIWVNENEMKLLREKNVSIAITTESDLKLASGFAPMKEYLENGVNVCLGTDGVASNNNLDILEEMDFTSKLQKAYNQDPTFLPAIDIVRMCTINSAKAFKKDSEIGSIEIGKKADIILINKSQLDTIPMYNVYSHLVYTISSYYVKDVIINGKIVMENRKLVNVDEAEIIDRANYYKKKIINGL
ncbi:MAG: amidohydrolase [Candidatus Cloacimonetes bacterium]|nr:amidohydrolase [Candidatus Cloacimonadota bacterium]